MSEREQKAFAPTHLLPDAVSPGDRLDVLLRVKVGVEDHDRVGCCEVDPCSAKPRVISEGEDEKIENANRRPQLSSTGDSKRRPSPVH